MSNEDVDQKALGEHIKSITQQNKKLTNAGRVLIDTIIRDKNIMIFPKPKEITSEMIEKIKKKIEKVHSTVIRKNVAISLPV